MSSKFLATTLTALTLGAPISAFAQASAPCVAGSTCSPSGLQIDTAVLGQVDTLTNIMLRGESRVVQDNLPHDGLWFSTNNSRNQASPSGLQRSTQWMKHAALGYGFGGSSGISVFVTYGQGEGRTADGQHAAKIRGYGFGLGFDRQFNQTQLSGAVFGGTMHSTISSPNSLSGSADYDGTQTGATLRLSGPMRGGRFDYAVQVDYSQHEIEDYQLSGLGRGHVGKRTTKTTALALELGMPLSTKAADLRPFAGITRVFGDQADFSFNDASGTTRFAAPDMFNETEVTLGLEFDTPGFAGLNGRLSLSRNTGGNNGFSARLGMAF
jgi:cytoskeletal protein CcmA (bactofilin family)